MISGGIRPLLPGELRDAAYDLASDIRWIAGQLFSGGLAGAGVCFFPFWRPPRADDAGTFPGYGAVVMESISGMAAYFGEFFSTSIKLFALMTPPAALSAYLSASKAYDEARKKETVRKTSIAVFVIGVILFFLGDKIFSIFGFTLDAFRIGAGSLLFLTSVSLMNETPDRPYFSPTDDISIVPLAIPLCMGPASIGTVMVLGASAQDTPQLIIGALSLLTASIGIYGILYFASAVERALGKTGLAVLSKLTGLLLAAIAAQVVFTGVRSFLQ